MTTFGGYTALVTGATSGIGRAIALQLAQRGAEVVVHGRNAQRGAAVVREIEKGGGTARFVTAELNDAGQVRRLAADAGQVDILVNNAGVFIFGDTVETGDAVFDEHVNVNMRAPYLLVQALAPGMAQRGRGAVVNISTLAASAPKRKGGIYGATKAALELLTKVWADEFGESGVRVNAVAAGPTDTPGTEATPGLLEKLAGVTALRRIADADEIASAVVFLLSPEASYVNGSIFNVTGGDTSFAR